jgi:hypothetical protein
MLDHLDVSRNALNGTLPPAFGGLSALQHLDASHNLLHGSLPSAWSGLTLLEVRRWQRIWAPYYMIMEAPTLPSIRFRSKVISRRCWPFSPPEPCAQVMDLSFNLLSSSLPESWSRLAFLSTLSLRSNALTGSLPPSWAAQTQLLQL